MSNSSKIDDKASPYGTLAPAFPLANRKPISLPRLLGMCERQEKIVMLTAYDATFAAIADAAGVDCVLVGDSLGMVCQGLQTTVGVSVEQMRYHTECVSRGIRRTQGTAWIVSDLPFGSYQESKEQAIRNASILMQAGAHMIKLEGGGWTAEIVNFLVERGILVCAHLGLTPQTVYALGGYRVQGKTEEAAAQIMLHATELADAGAAMMVLEMVPAELTKRITKAIEKTCITIGIGSGKDSNGQVLVLHDMLGMALSKTPKFVRNFMSGHDSVTQAIAAYVHEVKEGEFPVNETHAW